MAGVQIDGVNNKIDFDDDLDTSISANTDDTLVIEAGGNTMATITATTFTINDGTTITTADNSDTLTLISTDADASGGPNLRLYRNSSSPEDGNQLAKIDFEGRNDNSQDVSYFDITSYTRDVSDGEEDGILLIHGIKAGSSVEYIRIDPHSSHNGIVFNDGSTDMDFRVESNASSHLLFVDGGNDKVLIDSGNASTAPARTLHVRSGDSSVASFEGHQGEGLVISSGTDGQIDLVGYDDGATAYNKLIIRSNGSGNNIEVNTDGSVTMPLQPAFQVRPSSDQSVSPSGWFTVAVSPASISHKALAVRYQ